MTGRAVAVGQFLLEANTFSPLRHDLSAFEPAGLYLDGGFGRSDLPDDELAAAWDVLAANGFRLVPTVRAWAGAGPQLTSGAFEAILHGIVEPLTDGLAGVFLSLHGASAAENVDDPEGEILERVRTRVGRHVPIAVSLDCHAGITDRMVDNADVITAYRTVPHMDLYRTGRQAGELLVSAMNGGTRPVTGRVTIPMVAPADRQSNDLEPFGSLMGACAEAENRPGVLAAAFFPSHPWRDVESLSWSVTCTTDGDADLADDVATAIAEAVWRARHELTGSERPDVATALRTALAGPAPFVLADAGDSPTGGSPGDSTELLRAAAPHSDHPIHLTIRDPRAARSCMAAGAGAMLRVALGNGATGTYNEATPVVAVVESLPAGGFTYTGSLAAGRRGTLGDAAVLAMGEIRIVVHSETVMLIDPAPYEAAGLDPSTAMVIQAKSHVSYREGFARITDCSVVANTPGPTAADLRLLPYRRRPSPLFPFEDDVNPSPIRR